MEREPLGVRLKRLREAEGLTAAELSRKSGFNQAVIHKLETGKQPTTSPDVISALARALRVNAPYLMFGTGPVREDDSLDKCLAFYEPGTWREETVAVARYENIKGKTMRPAEWPERLDLIETALNAVLGEPDSHSKVYQVRKSVTPPQK